MSLSESRWVVMWGLAFLIYATFKVATWLLRERRPVPWWHHVVYLVAWPGMDVDQFLGSSFHGIARPSRREWIFAASKLTAGIGMLSGAATMSDQVDWWVAGWLGMIGIVFTLHFGLFHLLSCWWRRCGFNAVPLMNWPIASRSVADFWGHRWNRAFRDLTHKFIFRPLISRWGPSRACVGGFVISGLVHDVVISLPAGGGWGLPTVYFSFQGCCILFERSEPGKRIGCRQGVTGRLFALACLVIPCPLLFHPAFVQNVILPFLNALKSLL